MEVAPHIVSLADAVEAYRDADLGLGASESAPVTFRMPLLGDVPAGSLVTVAGRTGVGKSFYLLQLLAAAEDPALLVSLEDPIAEVGRRVSRLPKATQSRVFVAYVLSRRLTDIAARAREAVERHGARVVAVDYLQLVRYDGGANPWSQTDQVHHTIADLKTLAKQLGFVLVLSSQLRRPQFGSEDAAPQLSELKDSSSIENSSELAILLHEREDGLVVARAAKSKWARRGQKQLYSRDDASGWLLPAEDAPLHEDE